MLGLVGRRCYREIKLREEKERDIQANNGSEREGLDWSEEDDTKKSSEEKRRELREREDNIGW